MKKIKEYFALWVFNNLLRVDDRKIVSWMLVKLSNIALKNKSKRMNCSQKGYTDKNRYLMSLDVTVIKIEED